jgi:hypothetical protein
MKSTTITIECVTDPESVRACQQLMTGVFHTELAFVGMAIPDAYEDVSVYFKICDGNKLAGTFRIVKPNRHNRCPATDVWPDADMLPAGSVCQFSRVAIRRQFRRRRLFTMAVTKAKRVARDVGASFILSDVLLQSREAYVHCGFEEAGGMICDPTVDVAQTGELNCVPMLLKVL